MVTRVYQLAATFSTGSDAIAYFDAIEEGYIVAVAGWLSSMSTNTAQVLGEVSFYGVDQTQVNNAQGVIYSLTLQTTAGAAPVNCNGSVSGIAIRITRGQRVYLNAIGVAGNSAYATFQVHVSTKS